jgi:hypothetical protein
MGVPAQVITGDAGVARSYQGPRLRVVADHDARLTQESAVAARVEDGLHVRATPRGEKPETQRLLDDIAHTHRFW